MKFSIATLLSLVTLVALAIGLELGLGLASFLLDSAEPPFWLSVLIFLTALGMPFVLPSAKDQSTTMMIPIATGIVTTSALGVALCSRWEAGGPFAGMANLFHLFAGLHISILLWSAIVIAMSFVPAWRNNAKYVLIVPVFWAICMAGLFAMG